MAVARPEVRPVPSCSSAYRRRDRATRARGRGRGGWCSAGGARRGGAVGAVAALPTARGGRTTFSLGRSRPSALLVSPTGPDTSRFAALFKSRERRRPASRCPRLITPGRAPRGATPSTSSATRARGTGSRREATGANEETRPSRVKGRRRRRLRRLGRLGRLGWNLRDRRRRRPPRPAPSTGPHAAKGTARSRARSSWRWSARLERSGKRTRGM